MPACADSGRPSGHRSGSSGCMAGRGSRKGVSRPLVQTTPPVGEKSGGDVRGLESDRAPASAVEGESLEGRAPEEAMATD